MFHCYFLSFLRACMTLFDIIRTHSVEQCELVRDRLQYFLHICTFNVKRNDMLACAWITSKFSFHGSASLYDIYYYHAHDACKLFLSGKKCQRKMCRTVNEKAEIVLSFFHVMSKFNVYCFLSWFRDVWYVSSWGTEWSFL